MNLIINYPIDKDDVNELNEKIAEFKATLVLESVRRLNITNEGKRKVMKELLKGLKSGKYKA